MNYVVEKDCLKKRKWREERDKFFIADNLNCAIVRLFLPKISLKIRYLLSQIFHILKN
jgi:hypothetical protein